MIVLKGNKNYTSKVAYCKMYIYCKQMGNPYIKTTSIQIQINLQIYFTMRYREKR